MINRSVFNSLLKVIILSLDLICSGNEFHSFGTRTLNALSISNDHMSLKNSNLLSKFVNFVFILGRFKSLIFVAHLSNDMDISCVIIVNQRLAQGTPSRKVGAAHVIHIHLCSQTDAL